MAKAKKKQILTAEESRKVVSTLFNAFQKAAKKHLTSIDGGEAFLIYSRTINALFQHNYHSAISFAHEQEEKRTADFEKKPMVTK